MNLFLLGCSINLNYLDVANWSSERYLCFLNIYNEIKDALRSCSVFFPGNFVQLPKPKMKGSGLYSGTFASAFWPVILFLVAASAFCPLFQPLGGSFYNSSLHFTAPTHLSAQLKIFNKGFKKKKPHISQKQKDCGKKIHNHCVWVIGLNTSN